MRGRMVAVGLIVAACVAVPGAIEAHEADEPVVADFDSAEPTPETASDGHYEYRRELESVYAPLAPCRLADSRTGLGFQSIDATTLQVRAAGECGVSADASAVVVALTATGGSQSGYLTLYPTGGARPEVSNVNFEAGGTVANSAIVRLTSSGSLSVYLYGDTEVIIDVVGMFVPLRWWEIPRAGRFSDLQPERLLDTRATGPIGAGGSVNVPLPASVPSDAAAISITLTATAPAGAGYFTAFPAGQPMPPTSTLNTDRVDQTRAVGAIIPVTAQGMTVFSEVGGNVIVDITGYFTGPSAEPTIDGVFVPVNPDRVLDTRIDNATMCVQLFDPSLSTLRLIPGPNGIRPVTPACLQVVEAVEMMALAANWTATGSAGAGYVTVHPDVEQVPPTSTVNVEVPGQSVAAFGVVAMDGNYVGLTPSIRTHFLVDVAGYFTSRGDTVGASPPVIQDPAGAAILAEAVGPLLWNRISPSTRVGTLNSPNYAGYANAGEINLSTSLAQAAPAVRRTLGAHEVGHLLSFRWFGETNDDSYASARGDAARRERVLALSPTRDETEAYECFAEAFAATVFDARGFGPYDYSNSYSGLYATCAQTPAARSLAAELWAESNT